MVTLPPPTIKRALASWEACEYSLPGKVFLGKAHGMSKLPFESLLDFPLAPWCCTCEASLSFDQVLESLSAPWCLRV